MCQVESVAETKVATEDRNSAAGPQTHIGQEANKTCDVKGAQTASVLPRCHCDHTTLTFSQVIYTQTLILQALVNKV